jgi:hypothetical protein
MSKTYRTIEFDLGRDVEAAVNKLLEYKMKGELVLGKFNGTILYSDTVTMDGAYLEITGMTKAELDKLKK